jgi:hypothetical protein
VTTLVKSVGSFVLYRRRGSGDGALYLVLVHRGLWFSAIPSNCFADGDNMTWSHNCKVVSGRFDRFIVKEMYGMFVLLLANLQTTVTRSVEVGCCYYCCFLFRRRKKEAKRRSVRVLYGTVPVRYLPAERRRPVFANR